MNLILYRASLTLFGLALCSIGQATTLVVLADEPNAPPCEQTFYTAPDWVDPNLIEGDVLPARIDPIGGVPRWKVSTGKLFREGPACDPDGDPYRVTSRTPGWSVASDSNTGRWTLAGEVVPGPQYVYVSITDNPGPYVEAKTGYYTVCIWGEPPENHAPILCRIGWLGLTLVTARSRFKRRRQRKGGTDATE